MKVNHRILKGALIAMSILELSGCGAKKEASAPVETETEMNLEFVSGDSVEPEESQKEEASEPAKESNTIEWYEKIKENSLLSVGTNGRLDAVLKRMEQGEDVTVVAIGGSVTEGAGAGSFDKSYADRFVQGLEAKYPDSSIEYLNVGFSGTPSSLGVIRYDNDVTNKLGKNPDIVLIEFAVNDWQEETNSRAYESMIKTILEKDENTAVILEFAVFRNKWNLEELYTGMGELYGLPMVSAKQGTKEAFENGNLTDTLFFYDEYHPTSYGHKIMADSLLYMIEQKSLEFQEKTDISFEKSIAGTDFTNMHMVDSTSPEVECGGFSVADTAIQGFQRTNELEFANNWMHTPESGNESFKATFNCKNILLDFKTSNKDSFGKASIYIDGEFVREVDGYSAGGWNNSNVILILDEKEVATHTLEVKMSEGNEDKNFTILTIGYTD